VRSVGGGVNAIGSRAPSAALRRMLASLAAALTIVGMTVPAPARAAGPDFVGVYSFVATCTSVCSGVYYHQMTIKTYDPTSGAFTGTGVSGAIQWTITGTILDGQVKFHIVYTQGNPGYTFDGTGTAAADGSTMSGTGTDFDQNRPAGTLNWTATRTGGGHTLPRSTSTTTTTTPAGNAGGAPPPKGGACTCTAMAVKTQGRGEIPGVNSPGFERRTEDFFTAVWSLSCTAGKGGCKGEVDVSVANVTNPAAPRATDIRLQLVPHQDIRSKQIVNAAGDAVECTITCKPGGATTTGGSFLVKLYSLNDLARAKRGGKTFDVTLKTFCGTGAAKVLSATKTMSFVFRSDGTLDVKASHYAQ
jgi:hypothetical protein